MPTTFHLRVWTRFLATPDQVWRLKTDPKQIAAEFRPFASFCLANPDALARALGGAVPAELQATYRPGRVLPVPWPVRVEAVTPGVSFRETSANRLFARWEHEHLFEPTPDGCRYVDAITFVSTLPAQKATAIVAKRLFEHRHAVAAKQLATDPEATGVAVLRVLVEDEDEQRKAG